MNGLRFINGIVLLTMLTMDAALAQESYLLSNLHPIDLKTNEYSMLIGTAARTQIGPRGRISMNFLYGPDYGIDNYQALDQLIEADGFNSFIFVVNDGDGTGQVAWETQVPGWAMFPGSDIIRSITTAEELGLVPTGEALVGLMANNKIAEQHPDWRAMEWTGEPNTYMGDHLCANSPFWQNNYLPLFREFFENYGDRIAAFVMWEGPAFACHSEWCDSAYANSGISDYRQWQLSERYNKLKELVETIRATGWKGKIIAAGAGGQEWEEEMWEKTLAAREYFTPEIKLYNDGIIDYFMPEMLIHSNYGPHVYRRSDVHYVYRSLMYQRSLFGDDIIPNTELFWDGRTKKPDELFRWLLEVWSAGYASYSVVGENKLYIEHYTPEQDEYRPSHRKIFKAFNELPRFGSPWPNFQFVVSLPLEESLFYGTVLGGVATLPPSSIGEFEGTDCIVLDASGDTAPAAIFTLKEGQDYTYNIDYFDNMNAGIALWVDYWSGGTWLDYRIGSLTLSNTGQFKNASFPIPASAIDSANDANVNTPGKQVAIRFWNGNNTWLTVPLAIESIEIKNATQEVVSKLYPIPGRADYVNVWDWYVKQSNILFKDVDRVLCGGSFINTRETNLPEIELYGIAPLEMPRVMIIPEGCPVPDLGGAENVLRLDVALFEDLQNEKGQIIDFLGSRITHRVRNKSTMVYVNWNRTDLGNRYLTVINHGDVAGMVEVDLEGGRIERLIDSTDLSGNPFSYTLTCDGWLHVDLSPYAAGAFKVSMNSRNHDELWMAY